MPTSTLSGEAERPKVADAVIEAELRTLTLETIAAVCALLRTRQRPEVGYSSRCKGCSVHHICLPRETALLRQQG
jgi:CRISPR/Cas system-associated exonuclease Cas4 (RecB family)